MARTFKEIPRAVCPCGAPEMFLQRPKMPVAPLPPETDPSTTDKKRLEIPWSTRGENPPAPTACPMVRAEKRSGNFHDFEFIAPVGCVDDDFVPDFVFEERAADGGFVGNFIVHRVRFRGARDFIRFVFL